MSNFFATNTVELPIGWYNNGQLKKRATIREMDAGVRLKLSKQRQNAKKRKKEVNEGMVLTSLLESSVLDINGDKPSVVDLNSLTIADRKYLLLEIRRLTRGDTIEGSIVCPYPDCNEEIEIAPISIDDIPVTRFKSDQDFIISEGGDFVISLSNPDLGIDVGMALLTGSDQIELSDIIQEDEIKAGFATTAVSLRMFKRGDTEPITSGFTMDWVANNLRYRDLEWLEKAYGENMPGPDFEIASKCPFCNKKIRGDISQMDFLW